MKLAELQTLGPVGIGAAGSTATNFRESQGWDLTFQQGLVTIRKEKSELVRLVPMANVAWMAPAEEPKPKGA